MKSSQNARKSSTSRTSKSKTLKPGAHRAKRSVASFEIIEVLENRQFLSVSVTDVTITPSVTALASSTTKVSGYTPSQIRSAYDFDNLTGDGTGQTIAIVDAYNDPNIASDLSTFDKTFSLSDPKLSVVSQTGGSVSSIKTSGDWSDEIALDVEWAHAAAPGANIVLVEAKDDSLANLMAAVKYATSISSVSVVSMSWGTSEFSGQTKYDSYFTTPAGHQPITFVASSGDDGASSGVSWPASSSNVLSVGGTTITTTGSGSSTTITSETGWSDSGGGTSRYETASSAQAAVSGSTYRTTPDVSYDANPSSGYAVYNSVTDSSGVSGWSEVGGTSAGAPQWAALIAIANQARVAARMTTLSTNAVLASLYGTAASTTTYAADFNDITTGNNGAATSFFGNGFAPNAWGYGPGGGGGGWRHGGNGGTSSASTAATVGYDKVTGLGSPNADAIVSTLLGSTTTTSSSTSSTSTKVRTSVRAARAVAIEVQPVSPPTPTESLFNHSNQQDLSAEVQTAIATAAAATIGSGNATGNLTSTASTTGIGTAGTSLGKTFAVAGPGAGNVAMPASLRVDSLGNRLQAATLTDAFSLRRIRIEDDRDGSALHGSLHRQAEQIALAGIFSTTPIQTNADREELLIAGLVVLTAAHLASRKSADKRDRSSTAVAVGNETERDRDNSKLTA